MVALEDVLADLAAVVLVTEVVVLGRIVVVVGGSTVVVVAAPVVVVTGAAVVVVAAGAVVVVAAGADVDDVVWIVVVVDLGTGAPPRTEWTSAIRGPTTYG